MLDWTDQSAFKPSDVFGDAALAPSTIDTFFPIGNCRAVHLESSDYKNFTSVLSAEAMRKCCFLGNLYILNLFC